MRVGRRGMRVFYVVLNWPAVDEWEGDVGVGKGREWVEGLPFRLVRALPGQ